jgi:hypothetical protein
MLLLAEALRRRTRVPRYVHLVALAVGAVAAVILWRGGGLYAGGFGNALALLVSPAAVYYFFFQIGSRRQPEDSEPSSASAAEARDPDV